MQITQKPIQTSADPTGTNITNTDYTNINQCNANYTNIDHAKCQHTTADSIDEPQQNKAMTKQFNNECTFTQMMYDQQNILLKNSFSRKNFQTRTF
jgi:hypothetical protein